MPNVTVDEARTNFDQTLEDAQHDPVFISKDGGLKAVVLSWDAFRGLVERSGGRVPRQKLEALLSESIDRRRAVYEALSKLG